jgi:acetylxylan esterase
MFSTAAASLFLLAPALVSAANCPSVHVFGARETTASPGFGSTASVVSSITKAYSGATSEVINYPACGGQASCGGASYSQSVQAGVKAVTSQVNSFNQQCPNTVLVLVGYSQVRRSIFLFATPSLTSTHTGWPDLRRLILRRRRRQRRYLEHRQPPLCRRAEEDRCGHLHGRPAPRPGPLLQRRHVQVVWRKQFFPYITFHLLIMTFQFAPRPSGFQCPYAANIQSYCDANDEYCCSGTSAAVHNGYAPEYGSAALTFVKGKVNAMLGTKTTRSRIARDVAME